MKTLVFALCFVAVPSMAGPAEKAGEQGEDGADPGGALSRELPDDILNNPNFIAGWFPSRQIVNGRVTTNFKAVIGVAYEFERGTLMNCSGTLIEKRTVVTAAHCLDDSDRYFNEGATGYVVFGGDIWRGDIIDARTFSSFEQHARWNGSLDNGYDIGIIALDSTAVISPMPVTVADAGGIRAGEELTFVGFGITGDGRDDSGIKRTTDIPFDRINGQYLMSYSPNTNVCSGDSGGATLRDVSGTLHLAGVNSFVTDTDDTPCVGGGAGSTRLDLFSDWMESNSAWRADADTETETETETDSETETATDSGTETEPVPEVDYGDWDDLPERPPEGALGSCNTLPASPFSGLGFGGLALLLLARRRRFYQGSSS
ncbi:MAG: V8-like Glu-specific endopeptidase [Kiritimatiellia bacterium]|jgi:V8-like Glu-specific endopeptidase